MGVFSKAETPILCLLFVLVDSRSLPQLTTLLLFIEGSRLAKFRLTINKIVSRRLSHDSRFQYNLDVNYDLLLLPSVLLREYKCFGFMWKV